MTPDLGGMLPISSVFASELVAGWALAALALFIPVLCLLSAMVKRGRAERRKSQILRGFGLDRSLYYRLSTAVGSTDLVVQSWFPILVIFAINTYFAALLVYTPDLVGSAARIGNLLLLGPDYLKGASADGEVRSSFAAMGYAYLGWYVWTVSTIFSRMVTMELVVATYYSVLMRLVVAVFVALVAFRMNGLLFEIRVPEAIGFGVGLFPDSALHFISKTLQRLLLGSNRGADPFPLNMIQGVSAYRKLRLFELGLDNCQNLASANAIELYLNSNMKLPEVLDCIAQAQLAIVVGPDLFRTLQANGYRNAIDFHRACNSEVARPVLTGLLGWQQDHLRDLAGGMERSPTHLLLVDLLYRMNPLFAEGAGPVPERWVLARTIEVTVEAAPGLDERSDDRSDHQTHDHTERRKGHAAHGSERAHTRHPGFSETGDPVL